MEDEDEAGAFGSHQCGIYSSHVRAFASNPGHRPKSSTTMATTKKVAESTLYHLNSKGFWKKFSAQTIHLVVFDE